MTEFPSLFQNMTFLLVGKIDHAGIKQKAEGTSAQFANDATRKITHVLAPKNAASSQFGFKKFEKAVQMGVPIVDVEWFYESVANGRTLPTTNYIINVPFTERSINSDSQRSRPSIGEEENPSKKRKILPTDGQQGAGLGFGDRRLGSNAPSTPGASSGGLMSSRTAFTPRPSPGQGRSGFSLWATDAVRSVFARMKPFNSGQKFSPSRPSGFAGSASAVANSGAHGCSIGPLTTTITTTSTTSSFRPANKQIVSPGLSSSIISPSPSPDPPAHTLTATISAPSPTLSLVSSSSGSLFQSLASNTPRGHSLTPTYASAQQPAFIQPAPLQPSPSRPSVAQGQAPRASLAGLNCSSSTSAFHSSSASAALQKSQQRDPFENSSVFVPKIKVSTLTSSSSVSFSEALSRQIPEQLPSSSCSKENTPPTSSLNVPASVDTRFSASPRPRRNSLGGMPNPSPAPAVKAGRKSMGGALFAGGGGGFGGAMRPTASISSKYSAVPVPGRLTPPIANPQGPRQSMALARPPVANIARSPGRADHQHHSAHPPQMPFPALGVAQRSAASPPISTSKPAAPNTGIPLAVSGTTTAPPAYMRKSQPVFHPNLGHGMKKPISSNNSTEPLSARPQQPSKQPFAKPSSISPPPATTSGPRAPRPPIRGGGPTGGAISRLHNGLPACPSAASSSSSGAKTPEDTPLAAKIRNSPYIKDKINESEWRAIMRDVYEPKPEAEAKLWDSISGIENVKSILTETVILPTLRPDIFSGLRRPSKGLLLFGPPGNGKTLLAKAVGEKCRCTLISVTAGSLTSKFVGDGEKLMRALFAVARALQPSVIFIDEVDSLLGARAETDHEASKRLKCEYLAQMDGVSADTNDRVLVMAATNRPHLLDDAAIRRFTKRVFVPMPCPVARRGMFTNHFAGQKVQFSEADWDTMVEKTEGYSGSDIAALCGDMALQPVRDEMARIENIDMAEIRAITIADFLRSIENIRPSVCHEELMNMERFNAKHGSRS